jgi:D-alanyl-D-alanine dipeptidase
MSKSKADYDTILWSEIAFQENQIQIDLRYASENNFVKEQLYDCPRCFLRPEAAVALYDVQESLQEKGYRLKLFDCYRPTSIQKKLWEKVPNASYVTPPNKGSMHNRGYAVDATLINAEGMEVNMGTEFDYFGRRAHHDNRDLDSDILKNRDLLKNTMAEFGFKHIRTEWWHYSFQGPYQSPFKLADFQWSCEETH